MPNIIFNITTNAQGAITAVNAYGSALAQIGPVASKSSQQATTAFDRLEATMKKMQSAVTGFVAAFIFTRIISGIQDVINTGIQFQDAMVGIQTKVSGTNAEFERMAQSLIDLSTKLPVAAADLARIAEVGGQLGISKSNLMQFTESIAGIGTVSKLSGDEATTAFVRLADNLHIPQDQIKTLANAVFTLGSKEFPTTTEEVLHFSLALSGVAAMANMSASQTLAMATAMASAGLRAEKSSSSMIKVVTDIGEAINGSNHHLALFAQVSGLTAKEFTDAWKDNPTKAVLSFTAGLAEQKKAGADTIAIMDALGLKGVRVEDVMTRLGNVTDLATRALKASTDAMDGTGHALQDGVAKKAEDAAGQLKIVRDRLNAVEIELSNAVTPALLSTAKAFADLAQGTITYSSELKTLGLALTVIIGFGLTKWVMSAAAAVDALNISIAAWGAAILAVAVLLRDLKDTYDTVKQAQADQATAHDEEMQNLKKAAENFNNLGYHIEIYRTTVDQLRKDVLAAAADYREHEKAVRATAAATQAHTELIKIAGAEQAKYNALVQKHMDEVNNVTAKDKSWDDAIKNLLASGTSFQAIMLVHGNEIKKQIDLELALGHALNLQDAALLAYIEDARKGKQMVEESSSALIELLKHENDYLQFQREINHVLDVGTDTAKSYYAELVAIASIRSNQAAMNNVNSGGLSPIEILNEVNNNDPTHPGRNLPGENPMISPADMEKIKKQGDELAKASAAAYEREFSHAFDRLFEQFLAKGKITWRDFATFATDMFKPVIDAFTKQIKDGLMKAIVKPLTDWMDTFFNGPDGLFNKMGKFTGALAMAGAGIGGKIGGIGGAITGGAAGAALGLLQAGHPEAAAIAAAVAAVSAIVTVLISKTHLVANEFVQSFQNPFAQALASIVDENNALLASGKQTMQGATDAKTAVEDLWSKFQTAADTFAAKGRDNAIVVNQMYQNMRPLLNQILSDMDKGIATATEQEAAVAALKKQADDLAAAMQIIDKVTGAPTGVDAMEQALQMMSDTGVASSRILEVLGTDITNMNAALIAVGITVPPLIAQFAALQQAQQDAADAAAKLQTAIATQADVENKLADLQQQLADAYQQKLDLLNSKIQAAQTVIDGANSSIISLTASVSAAQKQLGDNVYWTNQYTNAISETQKAYDDAVRKQADLATQIQDLSRQVAEDQFQIIINATKGSVQAVYAQRSLDALKNQFAQQDAASRVTLLQTLQQQLAQSVGDVAQATADLDKAKTDATAQITAQKAALEEQITTQTIQIATLRNTITTEQNQISTLDALAQQTMAYMNILGVAQQSDIDKINATIDQLMKEGLALEDQRTQLELLTGIAAKSADIFHKLALAIAEAGSAADTASGGNGNPYGAPVDTIDKGTGLILPPGTLIIGGVPVGGGLPAGTSTTPGGTTIQPTITTTEDNTNTASGSTVTVQNPPGTNNPPVNTNPNNVWLGLGAFASGSSYIPRDGYAYLHRGEEVIPASRNRGGNTSAGDVHVHFSINAMDGPSVEKSVREQIFPALERMWRTDATKSRTRARSVLGV
jgi:TP901 family phage tail tape measure protein